MKKYELKALINEVIQEVDASHTRNKLKKLIREIIEEVHGLPESKYFKDWAKERKLDDKLDIVDFTQWAMKKYNLKTDKDLDEKIGNLIPGSDHTPPPGQPDVHSNYIVHSNKIKFIDDLYKEYQKDKTWTPRAQR